jgi:hypothetical protein
MIESVDVPLNLNRDFAAPTGMSQEIAAKRGIPGQSMVFNMVSLSRFFENTRRNCDSERYEPSVLKGLPMALVLHCIRSPEDFMVAHRQMATKTLDRLCDRVRALRELRDSASEELTVRSSRAK